jgi:hypothetical protein
VSGESQYEDQMMDLLPASHSLAHSFGVSASQVQLQKASFFATDDDFEESASKKQGCEVYANYIVFIKLNFHFLRESCSFLRACVTGNLQV